jgi:thiol-disulfide isomerase/thioredoxin
MEDLQVPDNYNIDMENYPEIPMPQSPPPPRQQIPEDTVQMLTSTKDLKAQALERGCNFCKGAFTEERKPHGHLGGTEFCYVHKDCASLLFDKIKEGYSWEQNETEIVHSVDNYKCPNCKKVLKSAKELVEEELAEKESKKRKSPEPAEEVEPETNSEKILRLERELKEAQEKLNRKRVVVKRASKGMSNISKLNSARVLYESIIKTLPTLKETRPDEDYTKFVRAIGKSFFKLAEKYIGEDSFDIEATEFKSGTKKIEYEEVNNFKDWKDEIRRVANENIEAERIRQRNKKQKTE